MYIWIGLVLNKEQEQKIRSLCRKINKDYSINEQSFTLPQHISLKTSFYTDNYKKIIEFLDNLYQNEPKLYLQVSNISELNNKVIWMDIEETDILREKHDNLNKLLKDNFNIDLSGFDGDNFHFHSTLFQESEENINIKQLYNDLKNNITIPFNIEIDSICIGLSKEGKVGTYQVVKEIKL